MYKFLNDQFIISFLMLSNTRYKDKKSLTISFMNAVSYAVTIVSNSCDNTTVAVS
jgi:hypothetical protein